MRHAPLQTLAILAALGGAAHAQSTPTPSPEAAAALEKQVATWLSALAPGLITLPPRPVQLTPEGDHYLLRIPLGAAGVEPPGAAFTAEAHMLDATRWALDDQRFPGDMTIKTTQQVPDAPDAKNPSPDGMHAQTVTYHIKLGEQDAHGVLDPTNAQPTTSTAAIASLDFDTTGSDTPSHTHAEHLTSQTSTHPTDANHMDVAAESAADAYVSESSLPTGGTITLKARTTHLASTVSGLAEDRVVPLIRAAAALAHMVKAPSGDQPEPTPAERAELHTLLQTAKAALTGLKLDQSFEGVTFDFAGQTGSLARMDVSFGGDAPKTMLSAQLGLLLDGLSLDSLPPEVAPYVPTHFAIHPTLANIDLAVLTQIGLDQTAPGKPKGAPDPKALFAHGGPQLGFDTLELELAGAKLTGAGKFTLPRPDYVNGQADLSATGLDALIAKLQADPAMAQAVPAAIFLKGIAKTNGESSVWQVTVNGAKILVNGVDLSMLAGAMK